MIHLLRRSRRSRLARRFVVIALSLLVPAQDLLARGGGGFRGGGGGFHGGGGGGFHGGGGNFGGRGGGGGFHGGGGGRPANPGASHSFSRPGGGGGGINHAGGGFGGGGMGGNRPPVSGGGGRGGIGGGGGRGGEGIGGRGGAGIGGRGGEGIGGGGRPGIGGGGRGGEGIGGRGGEGIGGRGNQGIGNRNGNNIGNRGGNNFNRGNTNIGNNVNINNNHFNNGAWGNHYGNFHNYNNYWHHGYWHGGWGYGWGGWGYGWGGLAAAGLIGWGLGSMYASSGYGGGYSNPYYASTGSSEAYLDYSQPIQPSAAPQTASGEGETPKAPSPEVAAALVPFDAAREAFKAGQYDEALKKVEEALKGLPSDAALHEFRALVLFALGRYKECASALYAVLSAGPGWDWTTLSSMYPSVDVYTKQLRALEAFGKQNPESPDAAFVLAYHYLTCGYKEAAAKELEAVIRLLPNDQLAPRLLSVVNGGAAPQGTEPAPGPRITPGPSGDSSEEPTPHPDDTGPPVDKSRVLGTWSASSGGGVRIKLTINDGGTFTWSMNQGARSNTIEGTYTLEGSTLELKQKSDGDTMTGKVTLNDKGGFNFKLLETGPGDPGLNFSK